MRITMFASKTLFAFLLLCFVEISLSNDDAVATCTMDTDGECIETASHKFESDGIAAKVEEAKKLDDMSTHERIAYLKRQKDKENKEKVARGEQINEREMKVLFQNKSGKKTKLWWKGPNENVLQSELDSPGEIVMLRLLSFIGSYCT